MIESYYYPQDINNDKFISRRVVFMALTGKSILEEREDLYKKYKDTKFQGMENQITGLVTLPLNSNINDTQSHNWGSTSYADTLSGGADKVIDWLAGKKGLAGKIGRGAGIVKGVIGTAKDIIDSPGTAALMDMMGCRRPVMNPGYYQNYSGSSLRSFSFSFTFIPENKEEAEQVISIINFFKKCSSPSLPGAMKDAGLIAKVTESVMLSPRTWEIYVCNETINKLMSFHRCVCTNVSVTYGDSEKVSMFADGVPKQMTLSLNFSEGQLQFADAYGEERIESTEAFFDKIITSFAETDVGKMADKGGQAMLESDIPVLGDLFRLAGKGGAYLHKTLNAGDTAKEKLPEPPAPSGNSSYRVWEK